MKIKVDGPKFRHVPDPHKRHSVVPNKKVYTRKGKARSGKAEPYDFLGL